VSVPVEVTFLGTAAAAVSPTANTSSQLVTRAGRDLLVDCGIGAVRQLGRTGTDPAALEALLMTHWHPDHAAGLPTLLRRRRRSAGTLRIFGPPPPRGLWTGVRAAAARGTDAELVPVADGEELELAGWRLTPVATEHGPASLGWVLRDAGGGRRVVISGDTRPIPGLEQAAAGADLLVHEATFLVQHGEKAAATGHSTAREAAELAARAGVRALALTHLPDRYDRAAIVAVAAAVYPAVVVPNDLDRIRIVEAGAELVPAGTIA
jgi:ribonuclease Z